MTQFKMEKKLVDATARNWGGQFNYSYKVKQEGDFYYRKFFPHITIIVIKQIYML